MLLKRIKFPPQVNISKEVGMRRTVINRAERDGSNEIFNKERGENDVR